MTKHIEKLIADGRWKGIATLQYFDVKDGISESNIVLLCTHGKIPRIGRQMFNVAGQKPIQWGDSLPDIWRNLPDNRLADVCEVLWGAVRYYAERDRWKLAGEDDFTNEPTFSLRNGPLHAKAALRHSEQIAKGSD